jgi:hypothetical protein
MIRVIKKLFSLNWNDILKQDRLFFKSYAKDDPQFQVGLIVIGMSHSLTIN